MCVVCTLLMLTLHFLKGKLFCCVGEFIEPPNHLVLAYAQLILSPLVYLIICN